MAIVGIAWLCVPIQRFSFGIEARITPTILLNWVCAPFVGFRFSPGALENQRLRRMIACEICGAARLVGVMQNIRQAPRFGQIITRLIEMPGGLRRHQSIPSRRISPISGMRSRYAPARNGKA